MKIACAGDNCIDLYEQTGERFPGGNPVNVAVNVVRLGGNASYLGAVGTDDSGKLVLDALSGRGVDVSHVRTVKGKTTVSHVIMVGGERTFGDYDEGVMKDFRLSEEDVDFICTQDLFVTSLWGHCEDALQQIQGAGVPTAFDASERPFSGPAQKAAPYTDVFFFSDDRSGRHELEEMMRRIRETGARTVVAMRGHNGSLALDETGFVSQGIVSEEVVDTIGAGDSYIAGFLTARTEGRPLGECMRAGAESAAVTIRVRGAWA